VLNNYQRHSFGASINWINIIDRCEAVLAICPFRAYRNLERGQAMTRGVSKKPASIKLAYALANQADGLRILVDRL
jgi:hypothetical protein